MLFSLLNFLSSLSTLFLIMGEVNVENSDIKQIETERESKSESEIEREERWKEI